jgi:hypothetical protein
MATIKGPLHRIGVRVNKACFSYLPISNVILGAGSADTIKVEMKFSLQTFGGHRLARVRHWWRRWLPFRTRRPKLYSTCRSVWDGESGVTLSLAVR